MPDLVTPTQRNLLKQADAASGFVTIRTEEGAQPLCDGESAKDAAEQLITRRMLTFARHERSGWTYRMTPFGKSVLEVLTGKEAETPT